MGYTNNTFINVRWDLGDPLLVNYPTLSTAAPTLATDGLPKSLWAGYYSMSNLIYFQKTAARTINLWLYSNGVWYLADNMVFSGLGNEVYDMYSIVQEERIYLQLDSLVGVVQIDLTFYR